MFEGGFNHTGKCKVGMLFLVVYHFLTCSLDCFHTLIFHYSLISDYLNVYKPTSFIFLYDDLLMYFKRAGLIIYKGKFSTTCITELFNAN